MISRRWISMPLIGSICINNHSLIMSESVFVNQAQLQQNALASLCANGVQGLLDTLDEMRKKSIAKPPSLAISQIPTLLYLPVALYFEDVRNLKMHFILQIREKWRFLVFPEVDGEDVVEGRAVYSLPFLQECYSKGWLSRDAAKAFLIWHVIKDLLRPEDNTGYITSAGFTYFILGHGSPRDIRTKAVVHARGTDNMYFQIQATKTRLAKQPAGDEINTITVDPEAATAIPTNMLRNALKQTNLIDQMDQS